MITPGPGVRIWIAAGVTDMRRGFDGLAAMVQQQLGQAGIDVRSDTRE